MNMIDGRLRFTIDYFRNQRYDQLIASGDIPAIIGQTLPKRNIGKSENSGFDGELNYRGSIGDFSYNVGTTFLMLKIRWYMLVKHRLTLIRHKPDIV